MAQQTPARQLYDLLVSRDFNPELLDVSGRPTSDPSDAEVVSFNYVAESGKDYGTVVVMLGNDSDLTVFSGDNVGKSMEVQDKKGWFDFLYQLKNFSTKNLLSFNIQNLNRLRYSMQGQAAVKEGLFEAWCGTRTISYNGLATEARLMIKHKKPLGENDARYRYVESLYIETAEGERFKLPFNKLAGGRAMLEHVRQGGRPYDMRGQHITTMVEELSVLSRFRRANHGKIFEGDTEQLITETNTYYENLNHLLKGLSSGRGYAQYFESWNPADATEQDVVIEDIKNLFLTQSIDSRIEAALPVLARIQQQGQAMKEAQIFEQWIDNLSEGTWALPETPEQKEQLAMLLSKELPVGPDATNATEQLYDLIGDDQLFDRLGDLAERDASANAWDDRAVMARLYELAEVDQNLAEVLNKVKPQQALGEVDPNNFDSDWDYQDAVSRSGRSRSGYRPAGYDPDDTFDADVAYSKKMYQLGQQQKRNADHDRLATGTNEGMDEEQGAVASAITRRILSQRLDLVKKYGPVAITQAIDDVADFVGDVEEIGSSDVSGWVNQVERSLGQEQGMEEGIEGRGHFIRHNIWTVMDGDEEVMQHPVEGDPFFSAKKFMRDLDDEGYDFTHVVSPEGKISYLPQFDPRNFPKDDMAEGVMDTVKKVGKKVFDKLGGGNDEDLIKDLQRKAGVPATGKKPAQPVKENVTLDESGQTLQHIKDTFKRDVKDFLAGGEMSDHLYDALYDYYFDDMPYGTQKARDGDPNEWVANRFEQDCGTQASNMNGNPQDYAQEGLAGAALGGLAGAALTKTPTGAMTGANIGSEIQDTIANEDKCNMSGPGEHCPVHGIKECGMASSMPVAQPDTALSRLRELANIR